MPAAKETAPSATWRFNYAMKICRKVWFSAAILTFAFAAIGQAAINEDGDFQIWTQEAAVFKITDNVTGSFDAMFRFGDDASDLWYQHYDVGVIFKATKWLSIKPSFRLKMVDLDFATGDKWRNIYNPNINFVFSHKIGGVKLVNNCRFSYWDWDENWGKKKKDLLYYRNCSMVVGPWSWTKAEIKPFIKEDFFYNTDTNRIDRNRLSVGLMTGKSKVVSPSMYFMWQMDKATGVWRDNYIVGLDFKFKF